MTTETIGYLKSLLQNDIHSTEKTNYQKV